MTDSAPHSIVAAWDGGSRLRVALSGLSAETACHLAARTAAGWRLVARRRLRDGAAGLELAGLLPPECQEAALIALAADGSARETELLLRGAIAPDDPAAARRFEPSADDGADMVLIGGNVAAADDGARSGGFPARLRVGPFGPAGAWAARRFTVTAGVRDGEARLLIEPGAGAAGDHAREQAGDHAGAAADAEIMTAVIADGGGAALIPLAEAPGASRSPDGRGWSVPAPADGAALILFGAPCVQLVWTAGDGGPAAAGSMVARELVIAAKAGQLAALSLDQALRDTDASGLVAQGGPTSHAMVRAGDAAKPVRAALFSVYDPRVQSVRGAARRAWAQRGGLWPEALQPEPWRDAFTAAGWPDVLVGAVRARPAREQALLAEWTLAEPMQGRLLAALRITPDSLPAPAATAASGPVLQAFARLDARDRLRAAAALADEPQARRLLQEAAEDLGRAWLPLSAMLEAARLLALHEPARPAPPAPTKNEAAARALLRTWCEAAGEPDLLTELGPGQDALETAAALAALMREAESRMRQPSQILRAFHGLIDRQIELGLGGARDAALAGMLAHAGRFLLLRTAVTLADRAAGLDVAGPPANEAERLKLGLMRRMRVALPDNIDAYLGIAAERDARRLAVELASRWGVEP